MKWELNGSRFRHAVKAHLAAMLAILLIAAGLLAVNHAIHRSLHEGSGAGHHLCVVCSLAKGQVSAAEVVLLLVVLPATFFYISQPIVQGFLPGPDHLLAPSRAPPAS